MPFTIVRQDITKMKVDAIVNAANTALQKGGGVCGAIFEAAGSVDLQTACDRIAPIMTGEAVVTPGFKLPAKRIIHTAGPVYRDGKHGEKAALQSCYRNSLKRAAENACESIAFPLVSSGIYGYPKEDALRVATAVIQEFLSDHDMDIYLAVLDKDALSISEKLIGDVAGYVDEHFIEARKSKRQSQKLFAFQVDELDAFSSTMVSENKIMAAPIIGIDNLMDTLDDSFSETLLRLIDEKGRTDIEIYKRANLDRKLFSKIRTGKGYMPSKRTAVALAVALELSLEETDNLLKRAGYTLSRSQKTDVIVEYFIINGRYDIFEINEVLFKYDQPLLGG